MGAIPPPLQEFLQTARQSLTIAAIPKNPSQIRP